MPEWSAAILSAGIGILIFTFLVWVDVKWFKIKFSPQLTADKGAFYGTHGFRKFLRISSSVFTILASIILFITSNYLIGFLLLGLGLFGLSKGWIATLKQPNIIRDDSIP